MITSACICLIAWLALTISTLFVAVRKPAGWLTSLVMADAVASVLLVMQLIQRLALGTMLDVIAFVVFGIVIKAMVLERVTVTRSWPRVALAAVVLSYAAAVVAAQPWQALMRVADNSRVARDFDALLGGHADLPNMDGLAAPLLFPSADLIVAQGAASSTAGGRFLQRHYPRIQAMSTRGRSRVIGAPCRHSGVHRCVSADANPEGRVAGELRTDAGFRSQSVP